MNKKRAVVWSEPPKQSVLQGAVMKEITGVDQVNARGLYSKNTSTLIMASCFLLCNDIPRVDAVDGGLARRLIVIPFRSLFKSPDEIAKMANAKNVYEADGYYDSQEFRNEFRLTFFHVLLGYFKDFKAHGYMMRDIPKTIKDMSAQYLADSDDFLGWFSDVYEKADDSYIQLKDVWACFKTSDLYQNLNKAEKRIMNRAKMTENVKKNPTLKCYYKEKHQPTVDGKQKCIKHALMGYRMKIEEVSDDEEDEDVMSML
jgi:phage/plasmid-associated DNA primase